MKKEIITYEVHCDICDRPLEDDGTRLNDGRYSEPFVRSDSYDLCLTCAGKLLDTQLKHKIPEDKMKDMIYKTKQLIDGISCSPLDHEDFIDITKVVEVDGILMPKYVTNGMFKVHPSNIKCSLGDLGTLKDL